MERLGVYKQWKHKRLIKELENRILVDCAEPFQARQIQDLNSYLQNSGNWERWIKLNKIPMTSPYLSGLYHLRHAAHNSLTEGKPDYGTPVSRCHVLAPQPAVLSGSAGSVLLQQDKECFHRLLRCLQRSALSMLLSLELEETSPSGFLVKHVTQSAISAGYYY